MKNIMKFSYALSMLVTSFTLTSCVATDGGYQGNNKPAAYNNSLGGHWILSNINNSAYSGTRITLQVENNKVSGFSGCNRYFTSTTQQGGGVLNFGFIGSTKMLCSNHESNQLEAAYLRSLRLVRSYQLRGNQLILQGNGTNLIFTR